MSDTQCRDRQVEKCPIEPSRSRLYSGQCSQRRGADIANEKQSQAKISRKAGANTSEISPRYEHFARCESSVRTPLHIQESIPQPGVVDGALALFTANFDRQAQGIRAFRLARPRKKKSKKSRDRCVQFIFPETSPLAEARQMGEGNRVVGEGNTGAGKIR